MGSRLENRDSLRKGDKSSPSFNYHSRNIVFVYTKSGSCASQASRFRSSQAERTSHAMPAVETLVTIAVAKMVAQKIADYSLAPLKVYCCSLFCTFREDLKDLEMELLCLEIQLKEKDKSLFGIQVADDGQAVLAQSWLRDAKQLAFDIEDIIDEFVCSEEIYHGSTCAHKVRLLLWFLPGRSCKNKVCVFSKTFFLFTL